MNEQFKLHGRAVDRTGIVYGRLTAIKPVGRVSSGGITWECQYACNNIVVINGSHLQQGLTRSCGCLRMHKHAGPKYRRLYDQHRGMMSRSYNVKSNRYCTYGAKGIGVEFDLHNFDDYAEFALANGYRDDLTIDRINVTRGYFKDNIQYISSAENTSRMQDYYRHHGAFKGVSRTSNGKCWQAYSFAPTKYLGTYKTHLCACYAVHCAEVL